MPAGRPPGRGAQARHGYRAPGVWHMYFATDDCDGAAKRITDAGGTVLRAAQDLGDLARTVLAQDPVGAAFGLWQGRTHPGCEVVNEPNALVRNDLITPDPGPARDFYTSLFDFSLDANEALPEQDFTFLRRPDGHEIGGITGVPHVPGSHWHTIFEVADTDDLVARCVAAGGSAGEVSDFIYGRRAAITDPFGNGFEVIARPATP